jgi:hypothetical protein
MFGEQAKELEAADAKAEAERERAERRAQRKAKAQAKAIAKANGEVVEDEDAEAEEEEDDEELSVEELSGDEKEDGAAEDEQSKLKRKEAEQQQKSALAALVASGEYAARKRELQYYFDAIRFIEPFEASVHSSVCALMGSKSTTDVLECIKLLVTANEFQIVNSDVCAFIDECVLIVVLKSK